ncbi:glycosyltransferase [Mycolicibacterium arenosum]|uniref:Glycosyltransferase n=1 Tax=Mycolicibacterium arenosum TaxID=2952157 RepID=A0ABT1M0K7_9MYCO|nr:glycosyltransferase [Mycolicibacterium sp. CAU 1645]MCP9272689.1 glycosyltransferase [Mycolicibacterium sp. CAU 1645]
MKFALAVHGTRGDVEPCAAVGRELRDRGHDVRMAVPPNLIGFVESAGLPGAVAYGPDSQAQLDDEFFSEFWRVQNPAALIRRGVDYLTEGWAQMSSALTELSDGADLILAGTTYQEVAANVAEHHGIPFAALHYFPARVNSSIVPFPVPRPVVRTVWTAAEWLHWRMLKRAEDEQRRDLGLDRATVRCARRIVERGALELQAYDELFFPGLAAEWHGTRPFTGALTLGLGAADDADVDAWIAAGTPPIYFGFGSMPVPSPADAVDMISTTCAELGERALVSAGVWDVAQMSPPPHVKLVGAVNHASVFPRCRAIVHHGGAGTTAASVRAGVPTVILWVGADQPVWAVQVKRLKVGTARRFSSTSGPKLTAALRVALTPRVQDRARVVSELVTDAATSVATAADLLEEKVGVMAGR